MTPDPDTLARVQWEAAMRTRRDNLRWILHPRTPASAETKALAAAAYVELPLEDIAP